MIVASVFDGDSNETIMEIQHKFYFENLEFMVFSAKEVYKNALEILDLNNELFLSSIDFRTFDHRIFQIHHDIIAAYFRFQFSNQLEQTLFETEKEHKIRLTDLWSKFWKDEISDLSRNPYWIRNIIYAVIIEEKEIRFQSERGLINTLKDRYYNFSECKWWQ